MMYYDYNKRSYLLPPGCKDLIDLLNLQEQKKQPSIQFPFLSGDILPDDAKKLSAPWKLKKNPKPTKGLPEIPALGEVTISDWVTVKELAKIAGQKPFKIIADLMEIGTFANVNQKIGFSVASQVLKKYGIIAKKSV